MDTFQICFAHAGGRRVCAGNQLTKLLFLYVSSGSWDATIRVWNISDSSCLACLSGHQADVYGIASHPQRPFFVISCSRDTTFRFWNLLELFPGTFVNEIQEYPVQQNSKVKRWVINPEGRARIKDMNGTVSSDFSRISLMCTYYLTPGVLLLMGPYR